MAPNALRNADLPRAFRDRNEHHIHDSDPADEQGDARDAAGDQLQDQDDPFGACQDTFSGYNPEFFTVSVQPSEDLSDVLGDAADVSPLIYVDKDDIVVVGARDPLLDRAQGNNDLSAPIPSEKLS